MRSRSDTLEHAGHRPSAKKSLLVAGVAIAAAAELIRRVASRVRERRLRGEFVSDDWIAQHLSSHGDGYTA